MAFDLGALETRMTVTGGADVKKEIGDVGTAMEDAAKKGKDLDESLDQTGKKSEQIQPKVKTLGQELTTMSSSTQQAFREIGATLLIAGLAITAALGLAISKYAEYDAAVSQVIAVTGAQGESLKSIRDLTQEYGAETVFTATEAAQGVESLAKAGVSTAAILSGGLKGSLDLAAAGELEVAEAADIAATALTQFNLKGSDVPHVADLIAAGAGKAQGSVGDMSAAFKQSGLVASQMGLSIEETTGTLAAFASAGLVGSDAGTSFRTMLLALATPTKQQADLMREYNIRAYENGQFVGIASLAQQLHTGKLAEATQQQRDHALGIIFGSDAIRAANVLYREGADGITDWTDAVNDSGYAAEFAATMQDNLAGDVEKLGGAFDTALITTGEGANGVLRDMVQLLTQAIDGYTALPPWLQQGGFGLAAVAAAALLVGGAFFMAVPKLAEFRVALKLLQADMASTTIFARGLASFMMGPWGVAFAAAAAVALLWANAQVEARQRASEFQTTLDAGTGALTNYTRQMVAKKLAESGAFEAAAEAGISQRELTSAVLEGGEALDEVNRKLTANNTIGTFFSGVGIRASMAQTTVKDLASAVTDSQAAWENEQAALEGNEDALGMTAGAYREVDGEITNVTESLGELIDGLKEANGQQIDATEAQIAYLESVAAVAEALAENGRTLDLNTEAGRDNMGVLLDQAGAAQKVADAAYAVDGNYQAYQATLEGARAQLIQNAQDLGMNAEEAQNFADRVLKIPSKAEVDVIVYDAAAIARINALNARIDAINARAITADLNGAASGNGQMGTYAYGGIAHVVNFAAQGRLSNRGALPHVRAAGSTTVWAEDETGGESYIPWAEDRRVGAEQLMMETARAFGGTYIPRGGNTKFAADGLITGDTSAPAMGVPAINLRVFIGDTELRVVAQEVVDETLTAFTVEYEGGTNL